MLCDDVAGVSSLGEMPFNPNTGTEVSTVCISSFRYRARTGPSSVETQDYTFKTPGWPGYYSRAGENLNGQLTQYEIFDYPGRFKDEAHGQAFARYQIEGWRHDTETATCVSNSAKLCPGKRFTLTGHPSGPLNREWQVVSCVLTGDQPQALHGSQGEGTTLHNHFEAIPAEGTVMQQTLLKEVPLSENEVKDEKRTTIPEELIFTAQEKITLSCGKSQITLYPSGKVVIKGDYILSDAEGVNRLSGGRIEVN